MIKAFAITAQAFRLWWREFILLILFNIVWLALQIPIVTGPPATAAMYGVARRLADGEYLAPQHGWLALRQVFIPALKWGLLNWLIVVAIAGNFWFYQNESGLGWIVLRLVWGIIALGWFAVNLFYWPFWLAQEDRSPRVTLRNSALFLAKRPGFGITLVLISVALIVVSILITLPLAAALMAWLALIGILAVDEELKRDRDTDDH